MAQERDASLIVLQVPDLLRPESCCIKGTLVEKRVLIGIPEVFLHLQDAYLRQTFRSDTLQIFIPA